MTLNVAEEVNELFNKKMNEFLAWSLENWLLTDNDRTGAGWVAEKSEDFIEGYNTAIKAMKGAFECWNEEQL